MTEYILTKKSNLIAVADSIRERTGGTGKITLGEMINDISYDIGGDGIDTSDATASENEILLGETAYVDGEKITGTIPTKTASNLTASGATVTVPAGYYATQATKSVATATQATPTVSIDSTGKITATATQTAGYVSAGTKTGTKQLAFQAAKTITPTTTSQIAVSSGYYTGGNITVAGDTNLVAENIVSGKSIFGVTGTATAGDDPFAIVSPFTYTVNTISGAQYGFTKNSNGYYESQNKGQNSSYAICRVNLTVTEACDIVFDVINYAESNYDYAIFVNLDSALALSNSADSNAKQNFKGQQSASVVNVTYSGVTIGNHYIDIKFIKDSSQHSNNDSVQFKLQEQKGSLSQETIDKILAADTDLVAENIKSGVSIFGVNGTLEEADYSMEDRLVTRKLTYYTNNRVSSIGKHAFYGYYDLTTVSFPACTTIRESAFQGCTSLATISFPVCTGIQSNAFNGCTKLTTVSFPACTTIGKSAFQGCTSLATISFPVCTGIQSNAFNGCTKLTTVSFPACVSISYYAFSNCTKLTTVSFPACTVIEQNAFYRCSSLTTVSFPVCTTIGNGAFRNCSSLTTASFPVCTSIPALAFYQCYRLTKLYLNASTVCSLYNSAAFSSTPIGGYSASAGTYGSIYVPASLLTSYKTATNWAYFSSRFVGI